MELHRRKRLEIIIEATVAPLLARKLQAVGATGYTTIQGTGGAGAGGAWQEGALSGAETKIVFIVVTSAALADKLAVELRDIVATYAGIVAISDVDVIRGEKF